LEQNGLSFDWINKSKRQFAGQTTGEFDMNHLKTRKENASSILLKEAFSFSLFNTEILDKVGESHMYTLDSPILYSEEPQR